MAKSELRLEAIKLRSQGESVIEIAKKLGVAKSTASLWVRHIVLSIEQLENLTQRSIVGAEKGRIVNSLKHKHARLLRIENENDQGRKEFSFLTQRELRIAGLSLYWAEGNKKTRRVRLINSDPKMIKFFIYWLNKIYNIPTTELYCQIGINEAHRHRESIVKLFWENTTGIPAHNFSKTSFKKFPLKKKYENFNNHYGTLTVEVRKPSRIYYKILGQVYGLSLAT